MPGCVRKDVLGGCTGGHVYESDGMIKDHSVCKPVASSGERVTVCVVDPQSVCHTERATASVLDGANRATRSPSSLHGENESTRADPFPAVAGSAPSRTTVPNKAAAEARPGSGLGSYTQGGMARRAPRVLGQDCGPAPAPPQRGTWKWTPAAPVARVPSPRRTPDTSRALCPNPATCLLFHSFPLFSPFLLDQRNSYYDHIGTSNIQACMINTNKQMISDKILTSIVMSFAEVTTIS